MKKKRIISLVMTLCLMVSLFAGMATAEAATEVKDNLYYYTMKAGQTVASICKELGVDFDANQKIIAYLNGYPKWSNMSIGTVVKIPTKDYKYTAAATTTTTTAGTTVTTATGNIQAGDYIAYYLVPYTLQQGDYLTNVCAALGSNYTTNASLIKRVNNLASVDKVMAGKTIYIPCPSVPAGTANALAVVAHKVGQGEIALNICDSYGVGYNANVSMLQALNNNTNLNKITSGSIFYLPVSASAASGITGGGSGTGTGTASNLSSEQYAVKSANSPNGSFEMRINGKKVTSANAGATIEVFAIANSGYSLSNIIVTDKDGNNLKVNGKTFVMPAGDVTVNAVFATAKKYTLNLNMISGKFKSPDGSEEVKNGTLHFEIDGKKVTEAGAGAQVKIVAEPKSGYEATKIYYSTSKSSDLSKWTVLGSSNTLTMPAGDVFFYVEFSKTQARAIIAKEAADKLIFKVGTRTTETAYSGATVAVSTEKKGAKISSIDVYRKDTGRIVNDDVNVNGTSFTMPPYEVEVDAEIVEQAFNLYASETSNGGVAFYVKGRRVAAATKGDTVTVVVTPDVGYAVDTVKLNGTAITLDSDGAYDYTMTAKDVVVTATFKEKEIKLSCGLKGNNVETSVNASFTVNGDNKVTKITGVSTLQDCGAVNIGDVIKVTAKLSSSARGGKIEAYYTVDDGNPISITLDKNGNGSFTVTGDGNVVLVVKYVAAVHKLGTIVHKNGTGSAYYYDDSFTKISEADVGETVHVNVEEPAGAFIKSVTYKNENGATCNATEDSGAYKFTMPDCDTAVTVTYGTLEYTIVKGENSDSFEVLSGSSVISAAKCNTTITVKPVVASDKKIGSVYAKYVYADASTSDLPVTEKSGKYNIKIGKPADGTKIEIGMTIISNTYSIKTKVNSSTMGSVYVLNANGNSASTAQPGETLTIDAVANAKYVFKSVTVKGKDGTPITVESDNTFKMPTQEVTVTATFEKDPTIPEGNIFEVITKNCDPNDVKVTWKYITSTETIDNANKFVYEKGATIEITVTYAEGMTIKSVSCNDTYGGAGTGAGYTKYTVTLQKTEADDITFTVTFNDPA